MMFITFLGRTQKPYPFPEVERDEKLNLGKLRDSIFYKKNSV